MSLGCRGSGIAVVSLVALLNLSASGPAWSYADAFTWKLVDGGPDTAEIRKCHDYIAAHPDFAKGYGSISMDSYCSCQANLLIGSIATDELLLVDRKLEPKLEPRRRDTGVFCLGLLVKQNEKRSAR